jgi:glutamine synthetase
VAAADQIQLYKLLTRQIANNMGYTASYLPKPVVGVNGSGMHTNVSVSKGKTNLFWDEKGEEQLSSFGWNFLDRILTQALDLCLVFNSSVNAYRRLDPHFEAPNQIRASATDRGAMVRVPIGNHRSMRTEVRAVAPDANPYLTLYSIFKTGIDGEISTAENLRAGGRYLPDNIQKAIDDFESSSGSQIDPRQRRAGPLCRIEAGSRQPFPARAGNDRQGLRGAVPPRGLQPVALEFVLERWAS